MTTIKFKNIKSLAKKLKEYVEKNHKLPAELTVGNVTYNYRQIGYILSKSVRNSGKDVEVIKVAKAPAPTGEHVSLTLNKKEYLEAAEDYYKFIEKKENHRLPNFSNIKGKKVTQRVSIYSFAKIIVFYSEIGRLPDNCKFYTSETVAKTKNSSSSKQTKGGTVCKTLHKITGIVITDYKSLYRAFYYAVYNYYLNDMKTQAKALSNFLKGNNCVDLNQLLYYGLKELGYKDIQIVRGTILCDKTYGHVWCRIKINGSWVNIDASAAAKGKGIGSMICGKITSITNYNPAWAVSDDGRT